MIGAIVGAAALGGCGRSVHNNNPQENLEQTRPRATDFVEVAWKDSSADIHTAGNGWITADGVHYRSDLPISIPASIPDRLQFKVDVPKKFTERSLSFHADLLSKDGVSTKVSFENMSRQGNVFRFQLSGVAQALAALPPGSVGERSVLMQVVGVDSETGGTMFEGEMALTTPPAKIEFVQESVESFEKHSGALSTSRKSIVFEGETYFLLQLVSFHNSSDFPAKLAVPSRPLGDLIAHFHDVSVDQRLCSYSTHSLVRARTLSSAFLVKSFSSDGERNDGEESVLLSVPARGNAVAGIYSTGKEVKQVAEGSYPRSVLDKGEVVDECNAYCEKGTEWMAQSAAGHWIGKSWPGASLVCTQLKMPIVSPGADFHGEDQKLIDECAEWELSLGLQPWDPSRFCQAPSRGDGAHERWQFNPHYTSIESGTETLPMTVELDPSALNGVLYFAGTNDHGTPESVKTPVFSQISTQ